MAVTEQVTIVLKAKDQASAVVNGVTGKFGGLSKMAMATTAAVGVAAVGAVAAVTKVVSDGVGKAMEMEQRVADIASVMGMAAGEVAPLQDLIANLGLDPTLKVNATEAADAIEMLARNGLSMTEILDGAAKATVLLANSTGGDFATAADVATDAMAQFGIDAADMQTAVDQITGVTVNSKFTINDYALALAQAGGVASGVGVDFEDFNAVIAAISPLFASGSDAGTSFKTMLQRLIPQSNDATDAMRALGLFTGLTNEEYAKTQEKLAAVNAEIAALDPTAESYADKLAKLQEEQSFLNSTLVEGQNAFFNADGSMKSMAEIAGILQRATMGLSEEQKNQMISTIFGTDAMRAAFGLMNAGEADVLALKGKIGDVSAEDAAATRMGTLKGALEILGGQYDALTTRIGEAFLPMFKNFTDRIIEYVDTNGPAIVAAFGNLVPAVESFVNWLFSTGIPAIGNFFLWLHRTMGDLGAAWNQAWPKIQGIVTAAQESIGEDTARILESLGKISQWFSDGEGSDAIDGWAAFFTTMSAVVSGTLTNITGAIATFAEAVTQLMTLFDSLKTMDFNTAGGAAAGIAQKYAELLTMPFTMPFTSSWDAWQNIQGRAAGGPVRRGAPYLVGEQGPELFVPGQTGTIVPNQDNRRSFTIENVNLVGSGNAAQDVLSSVQLLTALYG